MMKKMNNKAFSLVELIVSFVLISILSITIFRTVLSVQNRQLKNISYNAYVSLQAVINNPIQNDLTNKIITAVEFCGKNCYKIKYSDNVIKELSINREKKTIKYGNIVEKLPSSFYFSSDLELSEDKLDGIDENRYNSIFTFKIPISSTVLVDKMDLIYLYQYDRRVNDIKSYVN